MIKKVGDIALTIVIGFLSLNAVLLLVTSQSFAPLAIGAAGIVGCWGAGKFVISIFEIARERFR